MTVGVEKTLADTAGATDSVAAVLELGVAQVPIPRTIPFLVGELAGQDLTANPADTAGATDQVQLERSTPSADTAGVTDTASWTVTADRQAADTAGGTDNASVTRTVDQKPADTATGTDQVALGRSGGPADTSPATDTASVEQQLDRRPGDTATGTDEATLLQQLGRTVDDTATAADQADWTALLERQAADTAAATDEVQVEIFHAPSPVGLKNMQLLLSVDARTPVPQPDAVLPVTVPFEVGVEETVWLLPRPVVTVNVGNQVSLDTGIVQLTWLSDGRVILPPGGRVITGHMVISV